MEARAIARYVRISPRKADQVLGLIRGKQVEEARAGSSHFTPKNGARIAEKLLTSAVANARQPRGQGPRRGPRRALKAVAGAGPTMKRFLPRAQGRATPILKRTSHIYDQRSARATRREG